MTLLEISQPISAIEALAIIDGAIWRSGWHYGSLGAWEIPAAIALVAMLAVMFVALWFVLLVVNAAIIMGACRVTEAVRRPADSRKKDVVACESGGIPEGAGVGVVISLTRIDDDAETKGFLDEIVAMAQRGGVRMEIPASARRNGPDDSVAADATPGGAGASAAGDSEEIR